MTAEWGRDAPLVVAAAVAALRARGLATGDDPSALDCVATPGAMLMCCAAAQGAADDPDAALGRGVLALPAPPA